MSKTLLFLSFLVLAGRVSLAEEPSDLPGPGVVTVSAAIPVVDIQDDAGISPEEDIQRLFSLYIDARNTGMIDEAEMLAKQIVELSIVSYGYESRQTAHALTDLGELQTSNADYRAAVLNLVSAIEIIERIDDRLSISLVSPLRALGTTHLQSGDTSQALGSWRRAVHISHVNLGPHNYDQVETLNSIRRLLVAADMHKEANKIQQRIYHLSRRYIDNTYRSDSVQIRGL